MCWNIAGLNRADLFQKSFVERRIVMPSVNDIEVRKPSPEETEQCEVWPTWTCGVSEFDWEYGQSETCLVIEGEVTITDLPDSGESVSFGPGDLVTFPVGLECVWKVTALVRKHYNFS